jgi:hypothetical protein
MARRLLFLAGALMIAVALGLSTRPLPGAGPRRATENVILVMADGLRWQEVFAGAEEALLNKERGGVQDVPGLRKQFWRDTPEERRAVLMPFTWGVIAKEGQLYGNRRAGSTSRVTNGLNFSYPGYNEVLCGFADPAITSNDRKNNANVTVLEWLHGRPGFRDRIAAFTSWDVFPFIINTERSRLPVNSGNQPLTGVPDSDAVRLLNRLITETVPPSGDTRHDSFTFHAALAYLKARKPRVLYVSFDETDNYGHAGRYDRLLRAVHQADDYVKTLWETVQAMPEYRGKTTLIFCPDHGRGDGPVEWKNHGKKVKGSEHTWVAILGPDTPALGERTTIADVTHDQIAATLAAALDEDYRAACPRAGKPIADALK